LVTRTELTKGEVAQRCGWLILLSDEDYPRLASCLSSAKFTFFIPALYFGVAGLSPAPPNGGAGVFR